VVGRRGLGVWKVDRICGPIQYVDAHTGEKITSEEVKQKELGSNVGKQDVSKSPIGSEAAYETAASTNAPAATVSSAVEQVVANFTSTLGEIFEGESGEDDGKVRVSTTTVPANFSAQETRLATWMR